MDEFLILLQAKLDEVKSKENVNTDIDKIQSQIDKLKIQAEIDPKAISNLVKQLETVLNQKINISNININQSQISKSAQQTGQQIGQQIQQGMNSAIQKGKFKQEFFFSADKQNNVAKQAQQYFNGISNGVVSVQEKMQELDGKSSLQGFVVNIKNAKGEIESLSYSLRNIIDDTTGAVTGQMFKYTGGSINDNGVIKQINAISAKADNLQTKLDKLKANYSDVNASRPIKDSSNISALSQQYDKVAQAIENVRNSDNSTFSSMTSNAQKEITTLETMISQFRNAENVATQMKSVDISSGIAQATERLGKLKANASGFDQMTQTIQNLNTALSQVGDKASLDKFINDLRTAEAQLSRVKAEVKSSAEINKIQFSIDNGTYGAKIADLIAKTQQWSHQTDEVKKSLVELEAAYDGLKSDSTDEEKIEAAKRWEQAVKSVNNAVKQTKLEYATDSQISSFHQKLQEFYDKNSATHRQWGDDLKKMLTATSNGAKVTNTGLETMKSELDNINNAARQTGKLGKSFFDTIKSNIQSYLPWVSMAGVIGEVAQQVRKMYDAVYDIDTAMTNLYKVTDETSNKYTQFLNSASDSAHDLGRSISSLVEQTANWAKLGFSLDEAEQLAKISSIYANVGEADDDTAVNDMVTAMKAFNIEASDSITIVDKLNKLGNEYATSAADLGDGLSRSASAMATSGTDINKTLAMLTGGTEITQNASEFGNFLKIGSMRIRGMKGSLEELGEEVDETVDSISKVQTQILNRTGGKVNIFDDMGNFRDYYDIMEDISKVYNDLNDTDKADLTEILFGKQRGNQGAALIQAFQSGQIQKALEATLNAEGSAMQEQERWMDSLEAKTQQFEASFQSLSTTVINSNLLKFFVDLGTGAVSALDAIINKFGTLSTLTTLGSGALGATGHGSTNYILQIQ